MTAATSAAARTKRFSRISRRATATKAFIAPLLSLRRDLRQRPRGRSPRATSPTTPRPRRRPCRRKLLERVLVPVGDDRLDAPAADLHLHGVERIELRCRTRCASRSSGCRTGSSGTGTSASRRLRRGRACPPSGCRRASRSLRSRRGRASSGKTVVPRSARSPMSSSQNARRATTSRPSVGSSRTRSSGEGARARASSTWPFWPFDSRPNGVAGGTPNRSRRRSNDAASHRGIEPPAEGRDLPRRHGGRRVGLLGHDADAREKPRAMLPDVLAEESGRARLRLLLAEQRIARAKTCPRRCGRAARRRIRRPPRRRRRRRRSSSRSGPSGSESRAGAAPGRGHRTLVIGFSFFGAARSATRRRAPPRPRRGRLRSTTRRRRIRGPPAAGTSFAPRGPGPAATSATNVPSPRLTVRTPASARRWYAFATVAGLIRRSLRQIAHGRNGPSGLRARRRRRGGASPPRSGSRSGWRTRSRREGRASCITVVIQRCAACQGPCAEGPLDAVVVVADHGGERGDRDSGDEDRGERPRRRRPPSRRRRPRRRAKRRQPASSSPSCGPPMKKIMLTEVIRPAQRVRRRRAGGASGG